MIITDQLNLYYSKKATNPPFGANCRTVRDTLGKVKYRNNTTFFRPDLHCTRLVDKLIAKYQGVDKVNIYNFACSEGAEPFSIAMLLIRKLGEEKAQKFFPIIASDIDEEILRNPSQGVVKLAPLDLVLMRLTLGKDFTEFISRGNRFRYNRRFRNSVCTGEISPVLKKAVIFKKANILEDIENIEQENSVVLCRNFFPYLSKEDRVKLAGKLSQMLGRNSMCVIGTYDRFCLRIKALLNGQGLERIDGNPLWYEKAELTQEESPINMGSKVLRKFFHV